MPEISPELAARIETLKASHAENPARFFMPLASAWREAGETAKAEELLRENLKRHPGYLSAHVLLGRCLADRGAYAEARNEFQYVLSVDPQNLIALRTLGDMAAQGNDGAEARRWYDELLHVDPMNAEARAALAALDAAPPAPAAQPEPARPASEHDSFGMVEIATGESHEPDHPAAHADPGSWGDLSLDEPALASPAPEAHDEPAAGGFDTLDFGAVDLDAQPAEPEAGEPSVPAEPAAPATGGGFDMWGSVDDGQDGEADVEPLPLETYYEPEPEPAAAEAHDDHDEHGEVVTETIAELYARQGLPDRAADVYRQLIARRGEEPALVRRLEELEREMSAGSAAPADENATGFQDLDLPAFEPAERSSPESHAPAHEEPASTAWLETVDHVVAGTSAAEPAGAAIDLPAFAASHDHVGTGDAFVDSFAYGFAGAPAAAAVSDDVPEEQEDGRAEWEAPRVEEAEPAPELAGAAAFAATMEETPPAPAVDDIGGSTGGGDIEIPASTGSTGGGDIGISASTGDTGVELDSPAPAGEAGGDFPAPTGTAESEGPASEPGHGGHTIAAYLSAILAWRPGAAAPAASPEVAAAEAAPAAEPAPAAMDEAAPPPERPWDQETLGAAVEQPPMDEPWIAGGPAVADRPDQPEEPWAAEHPLDAAPAAEPWSEPAAEEAGEPWAAADEAPAVEAPTPEAEQWGLTPEQVPPGVGEESAGESEGEGEDLPWLSTEAEPAAGTEPAAPSQASSEEPMPWETGFDLSPEVPEEPVAERAAPRQEPTVEPAGGFSFEDFFAERQEEPQALPEPLPPPPPPPVVEAAAPPSPPAQPQQGGEEDEDLESFQAWLQSLKR